jgi:hypothetical protein
VIRLGLALLLGLAAVYAFGAQWGWDAVLPVLPDPPATERTRDLDLAAEAEEPVLRTPAQAESQAPPVREYALTPSEWQEGSAAPDDPPRNVPETVGTLVAASDDAPTAEDGAPADAPSADPVDLDRSAELVRRMLSLHRRAGERR